MAAPPRLVAAGRVTGPHGLRGQLRIRYFSDGPDALLGASRLCFARHEGDPEPVAHEVVQAAAGRSGEVRVALEGVAGREAADALKGRLVLLDLACLEGLPQGEYYGYQLIGCEVQQMDGTAIGTVTDIWGTGAHDVLVVRDAAGRDQLIPTASEFLREVDVEARRLVVELLPGMLDEG